MSSIITESKNKMKDSLKFQMNWNNRKQQYVLAILPHVDDRINVTTEKLAKTLLDIKSHNNVLFKIILKRS